MHAANNSSSWGRSLLEFFQSLDAFTQLGLVCQHSNGTVESSLILSVIANQDQGDLAMEEDTPVYCQMEPRVRRFRLARENG